MKKAKLSVIWNWAAINLTQTRRTYGNPTKKRACALGAIEYYRSDGERVIPEFNIWDDISYLKAISKFAKEYVKRDDDETHTIVYLNDYKKWSFKTFAKKAKAIGL